MTWNKKRISNSVMLVVFLSVFIRQLSHLTWMNYVGTYHIVDDLIFYGLMSVLFIMISFFIYLVPLILFFEYQSKFDFETIKLKKACVYKHVNSYVQSTRIRIYQMNQVIRC